jgi:hypothetical protein
VLLCFSRQASQAPSLCCTAAGPRTAKGIADALTAALPTTHISKLKDAPSYSNFTTTSSLPKVVLFTDKPKTSALYKSLSLRFKGRLAFAEVNNKASDIIEQQAVEKFPKLVVLDGDKTQEYSGCHRLQCYAWLEHFWLHSFLFHMIKAIFCQYQIMFINV